MPRTELDRRLAMLTETVLRVGEMIEASIGQAMDALARGDVQTAMAVIDHDDAVDKACTSIESMAANLITLQQPAVRDLRSVLAAISIAEDLERIGDHAEGIARLVTRLPKRPCDEALRALAGLGALARVQVQGALDAYRACDAARAVEVWASDRGVDTLYERLVRSQLSAMTGEREELTTDTYVLWIGHNLERIADRATNICERVIFIATGERTTHAVAS